MITLRRANERGSADHGWLKTQYSFSFSGYYDPSHMGFRSLRVMNEDYIAAGKGFGTHPHENMEIVTYVLEGALQHRDSMGNGEVLRPGEFQRITAGTGITHSEFNPSADEQAHLYQIWLFPERDGLEPGYEQKAFDPQGRKNRFQLVASRNGRDESLLIHQDVAIYLAELDGDATVQYSFAPDRHGWLQVLRGDISANGESLHQGDAIAISDVAALELQAAGQAGSAEVMLFDLA
ncbi:pirin family protein [Rhodopirellula sp. MGV]|uniref:pirin family protein n=1 Tax=Rhodopirellula sp. MGV TaxID=2023130 RepID=UPI000B96DFB2|nr:pirin family protein [Rhodopirellula sp. MGV]OYP30478.1 quercetin 2,3-dioxygenase [Rhodopirellula sp. MGV]PNY33546.1 pirin family protein [Rhodopirellula baltica]